MKTYLKNIIGAAALGLALLASSGPTWAGYLWAPEVEVACDVTAPNPPWYLRWSKYMSFNPWQCGHATGSLIGARVSSDNTQFIGCNVVETTAYRYVRCSAKTYDGRVVTCKSSDPKLIAVAHAMTSNSLISFRYRYFDNSTCDIIAVDNGSQYLD